MSGSISFTTAWFYAVLVDTTLSGAYTVVFILTLWVARGRRWYLSPPFLVIYASYLINLARTCTLVLTAYYTFIGRPQDSSLYFQDPLIPFPRTRLAAFDRYSWNVLTLLNYFTLIWRLWIIWSKNINIIILPTLLLIISVIISIVGVHPTSTPFFQISCIVFTLDAILNAVLATLISWKIWVSGGKGSGRFRRVAVVVLESGGIMSIGMLVSLITFAIGSNGLAIAWAAMAKIMGMSATSIVLVLNLDVGQKPDITEAIQAGPTPASDVCAERKVDTVENAH